MLPILRRPIRGRRFFPLCFRCEKVGVADTGAVNKNYFIFFDPTFGVGNPRVEGGRWGNALGKSGPPLLTNGFWGYIFVQKLNN